MLRLARHLGRLCRRALYIALDWWYVAYWQLRGLVTNSDDRQYVEPPRPRRVAVVMLPGVYEPWQFMKPLSDALYAEGYPVYVIAGLGYNTGTVPAMAAIVDQFIATLEAQRIVLVAHSKGGLIGKYLLANSNVDGRIKHVIAINTPFPGSIYANFAPVPSVRIFSTRDITINTLQLNKLANTHITSIYSGYDPNIPGSSQLDGAVNVQLPLIGHFRIVADAKLRAAVLATLAGLEIDEAM